MRSRKIDDPDLSLAEMFDAWPETADAFIRNGTLCYGCPIAPFHTVIDTCAEYHLDEATFRAQVAETVDEAHAEERPTERSRRPRLRA
ncbi:hypothetical protein [Wenxinia marina]|uniref:Hybrid cluster protein-associated redox disulfide domain protein n=1 Tax=Wenxinia marina DSM 24838 TaxID=1123501 RepID=A0A0D0Q742_9RHOB|nr:hypothetical protein [Wenxinia marina]KIQ70219.1 hybrid cluster protein-associated redox disulfide domain protein [Wenxinia marina DSM 24838]GGL50330.1 hypothetical protein GCM10011392_00730 [Wenxinia marina]